MNLFSLIKSSLTKEMWTQIVISVSTLKKRYILSRKLLEENFHVWPKMMAKFSKQSDYVFHFSSIVMFACRIILQGTQSELNALVTYYVSFSSGRCTVWLLYCAAPIAVKQRRLYLFSQFLDFISFKYQQET